MVLIPYLAKNISHQEKNTSNNRTYTNIKELTFDERIDEIARLIAGNNITEKTIEHAHEIIELAQCD